LDLSIALPSLWLLLACKPRTPVLAEQDFPRLLGVPKKKFRRRPQEESNLMSPNLTRFLEMFDSICWTLVALYICFVFQFLMVLAFHVYIHRRSSTSDIDILIKPAISSGASL
jgi:sterol desaturase/sphingolipid hydroxylase (fatty acid hydroxylase superfamily)